MSRHCSVLGLRCQRCVMRTSNCERHSLSEGIANLSWPTVPATLGLSLVSHLRDSLEDFSLRRESPLHRVILLRIGF